MVEYDFTSLKDTLNKRMSAGELRDSLMGLAFNYARCMREEYAEQFRDDMCVIECLVNEFEKLKEQE